MTYILLLLVSAAFALAVTPAVRTLAFRWHLTDAPGDRKIHLTPVPRIGGVAVLLSAMSALLVVRLFAYGAAWPPAPAAAMLPVAAGGALVFAVGLWDDVRSAPAVVRLFVQGVAATLVIGSGITIERITLFDTTYGLGVLSPAVTFIWIVGLTNAFNLMDGLDGLAAGLAVIASATCASILAARGHEPEALLLVALLGAAIGFLRYNFYPASIFLGDGGSLVFGFVLAVTAITGWQKGATTLAVGVPLLIFAVPILDTVSTVTRRLRQPRQGGTAAPRSLLDRILEADQSHIHHRLIASGMPHPRAVLLLYGLSLGLAILALVMVERP